MASFTPTSSLPKVSYLRLSLASFAEASTGFSLRLTVALTDEFRSPPPPGPAKKVTIQLVEGRDGAIVGTVATNREIPGSPPFNKAFHVTAAKLASCVPASGSVVPDESAGKVYSLLFVEEIQQARQPVVVMGVYSPSFTLSHGPLPSLTVNATLETYRPLPPAFPSMNIVESFGEALGSHIWDSSLAASRWLCDQGGEIKGKAVIELGAGLGVAGIVCASLAAGRVLVTEQPLPGLIELLSRNAAERGCEVGPLVWTCEALPSHVASQFDVAIAADVLYVDVQMWKALAATARGALRGAGGVFVLAQKHRESEDMSREQRLAAFEQVCEGAGLRRVPGRGGSEWCDGVDIVVFEVS